ncbi:hypothetical protein ENBRE01_2109 [Enteropsectra breve]|nr:hypothetical protein ENBRE01_2109 [Enteropsectra breve]
MPTDNRSNNSSLESSGSSSDKLADARGSNRKSKDRNEKTRMIKKTHSEDAPKKIMRMTKKEENFSDSDYEAENYANHMEYTKSHRKNALEELGYVAAEEADKMDIYEKGVYPSEKRYEPPFSPKKSSLYYLREAARIASEMPDYKNFGKDVQYKEAKEHASKKKVDPHDGVFRSFNDFNEGIFKLNFETGNYICPGAACGKEFPSLSRIKRHYIIHTDIKPFTCLNAKCSKTFSRKDNMLQHYRVHCPFTDENKKKQQS